MKKLVKMVLSAGCLVLGASGAFGESVDYWYLTNKQTVDATRITTGGGVGGGWYYAEGDVELELPLLCLGTTETPARIILKDGARLVLRGVTEYPGLYVGANSKLEIYGQRLGTGKLIAYGSANAPGIGGVASSGSTTCGSITVYGGNVEAHGGVNAPGIGGAYVSGGAGGLTGLTVVGGSVRAYGGANAPGVGGANGFVGLVMNVTITMGSLEAFGAEGRYGIGPGVSDFFGSDNYKGFYTANGQVNAVMTGTTGAESGSLVGQGLQVCASRYIRVIGAMNVTANTSEIGYGIWCLAQGEISRGTIDVNGSGHLVLWDGCDLRVSGGDKQPGLGVTPGNALEILGGPTGSGRLTAQGGANAAGIGGGFEGAGGEVTINGGTVTAAAGYWGAGIGGGNCGAGGTVTINGGDVTAQGGVNGELTLGEHALRVGDNHWQETVFVSFDIPSGIRLFSVRTDEGLREMTESGVSRRIRMMKGRSLTLVFGTVGFEYRPVENAVLVIGPVCADTALEGRMVPRTVETEKVSVVDYALPDGRTARAENVCPLYSTDLTLPMGQSAWYVVTGEVTTAALEVHGEVNLILSDGAKLTVNGGIGVDEGNVLNIYGQSAGTGRLIANGAESCAGIGGRNVTRIEGYGNCGTVTINGGTVTANGGGEGAGIGGGYKGAGGTVTINGGTVTATGEYWAAGIGGGWVGAGGTVTIGGGRVTVIGGKEASIIGGGWGGAGGTVTISGGIFGMAVDRAWCAEGFFAEKNPDPATREDYPWAVVPCAWVTVGERRHMTVLWTSGDGTETNAPAGECFGVPIGATNVRVIFVPNGLYSLKGDAVIDLGTATENVVLGLGGVPAAPKAFLPFDSFDYLDWDDTLKELKPASRSVQDCEIVDSDTRTFEDGKWYAVAEDIRIADGASIMVNGSAHLILCDGMSLTVNGGVRVEGENALNIYGQSNGTGKLIANGADGCAGIGGGAGLRGANGGIQTEYPIPVPGGEGGSGGTGGTVRVYGGTVTARGGAGGAGIGGGVGGRGGDGGTGGLLDKVEECGGGRGGAGGSGCSLTIYGGAVTATGGDGGAGIGGGAGGRGGYGGGCNSFGGSGGSGGVGGANGLLMICGGMVTATGGAGGAGIGGGVGGKGASCGVSPTFGADSGPSGNGGDGGDGGTLLVSGGTVTGSGVTGIGGGDGGSGYGGTNPGISGNPGAETKVTLDETKVEVAEGMYGNGHPYVKIAEKATVGPTCEGGTIEWSDAANAWVVTPNADVTAVTVAGLPEGAKLAVKCDGYAVPSAAFVGFGEGKTEGVFSLALDENGVVTIGGETIPVKPTIGDLDEGEPFAVGKGAVMVAVKAIPGLRYALVRGESVEAVCGGETPPQEMDVPQEPPAPQRVICESVVATGARVALSDANPPAGKAFYVISVSCPAAVVPSDSTIRIVGGRVYSGQYDITDAVAVREDGTVELKAGGVVGGVKVTPVIGDLPPSSDSVDDAASPLFLGESDGAELTFETIPGLCYGLLRGETPDKVDEVVDWRRAESGTLTLRDFNPPEDGALYRIVVKIEEF